MTHSFAQKLGVCALVAVFTVMTTAAGFAAERPAPASTPTTLLSSAQKQVRQIARVEAAAAARSAQQEGPGGYDQPGAFFKTKRGVALLALAAAGIGYMWYSAVNDRIHSQARERLSN